MAVKCFHAPFVLKIPRGGLSINSQQPRPHVYHLSAGRLVILPLFWLMMVGALLMPLFSDVPATSEESRAFVLTAVVLTAILLPFFWILWQSRLVLTPGGIVHHQFGYSVRSTWVNVEQLDLSPGNQSLILTEPGTTSSILRLSTKWIRGIRPIMGAAIFRDLDLLGGGRVILLSPFMAHWKRGPLRDDLLRWAPHLFDENGMAR